MIADTHEPSGLDPRIFWACIVSVVFHVLFLASIGLRGELSDDAKTPEITVRVIASEARSDASEGGDRQSRDRDEVAQSGAIEDILRFQEAPVQVPVEQEAPAEGEVPSTLPRPPAGDALARAAAAAPPQTGKREFRYPRWQVSPPLYPPPYIDRGGGAYVTLQIDIAADGSVVDVEIIETSGFPSLDYRAVEDATWRRYDKSPAGRRLFRIAQFYGPDP